MKPKVFTTSSDPADIGQFGAPFTEPTLNGKSTDAKCEDGAGPAGLMLCEPASGASAQLADARVLYWDNLGGPEGRCTRAVDGPDGTVLVGGHATISTAYLNDTCGSAATPR